MTAEQFQKAYARAQNARAYLRRVDCGRATIEFEHGRVVTVVAVEGRRVSALSTAYFNNTFVTFRERNGNVGILDAKA